MDVRSEEQRIIDLSATSKEFVLVAPFEGHTVMNQGEGDCELLVISSVEYDPKNPDTYKQQEYPEEYPKECENHGIRDCVSCVGVG